MRLRILPISSSISCRFLLLRLLSVSNFLMAARILEYSTKSPWSHLD